MAFFSKTVVVPSYVRYSAYLCGVRRRSARRATRQGLLDDARGVVGSSKQITDSVVQTMPQLQEAAANVTRVSSSIAQTMPQLQEAAGNVSRVSSAVVDTMPHLQQAAEQITNMSEDAGQTLRNINNAAVQAGDVLGKLQTAMSPVRILWDEIDLLPTMAKIARVIVNLSMARSSKKVYSLIYNIVVEFGSDIGDLIRNWLFTPEDVQLCPEAMRHATRQGLNLEDVSTFAYMQNWLSENTTLTVSTLAIAIFAVMQYTLGLPTKGMDVQGMIKFFGERSRHMKSMVDFGKSSWNIFTDVAEWIISTIFPGMIKNDLEAYITGYTAWSREVVGLVDPQNPVVERVKTDKALVYRIAQLYKQGMKYSANLAALKIKDDLRDHFQKCFSLISGFLKEADASGALGNRPRVKPFVMQLFGESGVGKSGMLWPLCSDLNAALCKTEEEARDIASETYFRSAEQEFWDGYAGQNICVWDDFGQLTDTSAKPNPEFFEVIRAGNAAPYSLHMATLGEKAKTKFISKFCILTSNKINQNVSSITFPSAYRRRIDLLCEVRVKEEFQKTGYNADTGEAVKRLDTSKCVGGADTRVYEFVLYNPETQQIMCDENGESMKMDYEELVCAILIRSKSNFNESIEFNQSITTRMTPERHAKMRSLLFGLEPVNNTVDKAVRKKQASKQCQPEAAEEVEYDPPPPAGVDETGRFLSYRQYREQQIQQEERQEREMRAYLLGIDPIDDLYSDLRPVQVPAPLPPKSSLKNWLQSAKKMLSLKTILLGVGTILGGLGLYSLIGHIWSTDEEEEEYERRLAYPEASCSGDNKTRHLKTIRSEGAVDHEEIRKSKSISRALRHEFRREDGWVEVDELLVHLQSKGVSLDDIVRIVKNDPKKRFEMIRTDKIRAIQGHSYKIDPDKFYEQNEQRFATHFTYGSRVSSINEEGIIKMNRAFVHLHPGHITKPPMDLPNRSVAIWVDLAGLESWKTSNGYILSENIPVDAIIKVVYMSKTEASCSGDNKTKHLPRMRTEASCSGDNRTKHLPRVRTEAAEDATLQAWKDKSAQELITHRILGNYYKISIDGKDRLNGLFIRDTCMLTVEHLTPWLEEGKEITIENMYGSRFTVPIKDLERRVIKDSLGNHKDAMILKFPRHINCHSDIIKHFQKMPELSERRADVCVPCIREIRGQKIFTILGNASCTISHASAIFDGVETQIRDALQYNLNTTGGDCGAPVIVNDTSFIRKIAGIHIAAYDDGSSALGQSVTQADLLKHLAEMEAIVVDHDDLPNFVPKNASLQVGDENTTEEILMMLDMPAETFGYIGQCGKISMPPSETDLRESPIHGYIPPTTKPAKLRHAQVNMVHRNMEKCAVNCPYIPQEEVDRAVGEVKSLLLSGTTRRRLAHVLTYEEAVAGSPISDYVDGIKRQSSPGYPHVFNKKPEHPGKTTWFGKDEWIFDREIEKLVNERIDLAKQGIRYPTVWSDTLKDERRPIAKVDALKTRVFAHGPMDYTIAFRMYFLGFIAHIMENRIHNEQSIGTNPFGMDWMLTAKRLSRFGKKVFAGDFSQFDGTLNSCIMKEFAAVANEFYNDGEDNARVREVLMLEIYNSIHLCSGKFIQLTHSQPSGNPLTTVLNSFYNSVSMRIAYYRCFPGGNAPAFRDNVSMVSYGDDNVINFSDTVAENFNQNTATEAYASFGMIYTDESKSSGQVAPWRSLTEVNYLKRTFRLEDGVWRAPLALETITESCNWIRKCNDPVEACTQNCETAFRELAQHDRKIFKSWVSTIANALYEKTGSYPVIKTRLDYLNDESPSF